MAQGSGSDNVIHPSQFSARTGGSGPDDPNLEGRLGRVEASIEEIRKEIQAIRVDLARIDGKISNIPTTFQIAFMLAAFMVANFIGATALSLAILRFSGNH